MKTLVGRKPVTPPPRTEDFDELEKKRIDVLIDATKYIATTCGIAIAFYSQIVQGHLKQSSIAEDPKAQLLLFLPLLLWFLTIVGTVIGIYPRTYRADTDLEKQQAMGKIRATKRFWLVVVLYLFLAGFTVFTYVLSAQIWRVYPFS